MFFEHIVYLNFKINCAVRTGEWKGLQATYVSRDVCGDPSNGGDVTCCCLRSSGPCNEKSLNNRCDFTVTSFWIHSHLSTLVEITHQHRSGRCSHLPQPLNKPKTRPAWSLRVPRYPRYFDIILSRAAANYLRRRLWALSRKNPIVSCFSFVLVTLPSIINCMCHWTIVGNSSF